jgi:NADPH-dependent ferric siderophore reductase
VALNESMLQSPANPIVERRRLESVRRSLTVEAVRRLSPRMIRVTLVGDELAGFTSPSPDDHIKVFFPMPGGDGEKRDYTPRHFDAKAHSLTIDFALHEGGVGAMWAEQATPGDSLQIGGPRGSTTISAPGAWWLLVGDETAIPSVGRRLEETAAGTRVIGVLAVTGPEEEQQFETKSNLTTHWIHRPDTLAADAGVFLKVLSGLELPAGPGYIWIGAEAEVSRAVRTYFVETLGHPTEWIKASAYWSQHPEEHK